MSIGLAEPRVETDVDAPRVLTIWRCERTGERPLLLAFASGSPSIVRGALAGSVVVAPGIISRRARTNRRCITVVIDDALQGQDSVRYPPEPRAARAARGQVEHALAGWPDEVVIDAVVLTSELASNAILHARTAFRVTVTVAGTVVRVDVADLGGGTPSIPEPPPLIGGRGLRMVDRAATRWGIRKENAETVVWFELER